MTASLFQGGSMPMQVVGEKAMGHLPQPAIHAQQTSDTMSDLQTMLANEKKQHEQAYIYANGHNDHGMGQ
jgi:hypothetical protein